MTRFLTLVTLPILFTLISCSSVTGIDDFGNFRSQVSDESLDQQTKDLFKQNAEVLTFRDQKEKSDQFLEFSKDLQSFYYDIQVHVATSEEGKIRPATSNTRIFESTNFHELIIEPSSTSAVIKRWKKGLITTGIEEIDQLLSNNDFYVEEEYNWNHLESPAFNIRRDRPINTPRVVSLLKDREDFKNVSVNNYLTIGSGNNITIEKNSDFLEVVYSIGTFTSGAQESGIYTFKIFEDGEVLFAGKS